MKVITSARNMQAVALAARRAGKTIGLVPTMGALHGGHLSLITRARRENDIVIVSIFVNPAQFGPQEDYLRYPRPFERDRATCRSAGVDYLFAPSPEAMYPAGYLTYITVEKMSGVLCGAFRPGHFRGVATVVAKLFNIAQPAKAYFGQKDYQQLKLLERMVADLNFPVKIVPCPIVRESSGLALSSRNQHLSPTEHEESTKIHAALQKAREMVACHNNDSRRIKKAVAALIRKIPGAKIDYIEVMNADTLEPLAKAVPPAVMAVAVRVGSTRLIDNIRLA
jgi:pantoate--beta-alanine ligase